MMGRLKTVMSHTRNMDMIMTDKTIKYAIPLYSELDSLGNFKGIEIREKEICLYFDVLKTGVEEIKKEGNLKIDNTPTLINFC